jgi:hypothetical protein
MIQQVRNAKRFGAAVTEMLVIVRPSLDEENAKHITPVSILKFSCARRLRYTLPITTSTACMGPCA